MTSETSTLRDAATVLLLRVSESSSFEVFMVRRHGKSKFMANAMVFPGGGLDESDCDPAWAEHSDLGAEEAAKRLGIEDPQLALGLLIAGVRETFEEVGVLLARDSGGWLTLSANVGARYARIRDELNAGNVGFWDVVRAEGLTLATSRLSAFAHWITPEVEPRRYDTRFLLTQAPQGQTPRHDARETTESAWLSPSAALTAYDNDEIQLAPPTLRVLEELADAADIGFVLASCERRVPPRILPRVAALGQSLHLLLPRDSEYATRSPTLDGRETIDRIVMADGRWRSRRSDRKPISEDASTAECGRAHR